METAAMESRRRQRGEPSWEVLLRSRERFRQAFQTSLDAVAFIRLRDGRFVDANEMFFSFTGYSREEVLQGVPWEPDIWENERTRDKLLSDLLRSGSVVNREMRLRDGGGKVRAGLLSAMIMSQEEEPHILLVIRNIDDLKRTEAALAASEARFRELFDNMNSGAVVLQAVENGRDFLFVDINREAERIEGVERSVMVGRSVAEALPSAVRSGLLSVFQRVWQSGQPERFPLSEVKGDRLSVWKENYIYKLSSGEIINVYDDVTERKQAERKLLEYQHQLQSLSSELSLVEERERRSIARDLHDQIGQTLSVVKMRCHSLKNRLDDDELRGQLDEIRELVQQTILDTRSLTFELSPPVLFELGLAAAVDWLVDDVRREYELDVRVEYTDRNLNLSEDLRIVLFRSIRELLMNIVKHARTDTARLKLRCDGEQVTAEIRDKGVGFNLKKVEARAIGKHGFGLFTVRERIRQLGGSLEIDSRPGDGTRAVLRVPRRPPANAS